MARKNPRRRLIAKIKAFDQQAREHTRQYNADATVLDAPVKSSWELPKAKGHTAHKSRWLANARVNYRKRTGKCAHDPRPLSTYTDEE